MALPYYLLGQIRLAGEPSAGGVVPGRKTKWALKCP